MCLIVVDDYDNGDDDDRDFCTTQSFVSGQAAEAG